MIETQDNTVTIDLGNGWDLVPIMNGVPEPDWRSRLASGSASAGLTKVFQQFSGELALVRRTPILLPGTTTRDAAAEERAFAMEMTPISLYLHALGILALLAVETIHPVHYAVARSALEKDAPDRLDQPAVVDLLARALQEAATSLLTAFRALRVFGDEDVPA